MNDEHHDRLHAYYAQDWDEDARLQSRSVGGRIEFERVRELVSRRLQPASRVLDVGGATGIHARWLADAGHTVTLIDPIAEQVTRAAAFGTFEAQVGDARALDFADASFDAVLLFGPLYHLRTRAERVLALTEAHRVLKPGGFVAAQGISRFSPLADRIAGGDFAILTADDWRIFTTGDWTNDGPGFPGGHFHTAVELLAEVTDAGFVDASVHTVEGPTSGAFERLRGPDEALVEVGLASVRALETAAEGRPDQQSFFADLSPHLMVFGRRAGR